MKIALWISGKMNSQVMLNWARDNKHEVKVLASMQPTVENSLPFATLNIDELKKVSDSSKIDLLFKSCKKTGDETLVAIDALLKYAAVKYGVEAVAVDPTPEVAHIIRNSAKKFKLKIVLLPKK